MPQVPLVFAADAVPSHGWLVWVIVLALNGAIILAGLWRARETHTSADWFLASKGLPWWMIGLSMFATAVDSGDYVAIAGKSYQDGMAQISAWWLGMTVGWFVLAYVVLMPMYRTGMYTNAEYLEYRFGPVARLISVLIQIQTRTQVLGAVAFSLFLTFSVLTGWGDQTWWLVGGIALGAAVYTASGGLKSVAFTDALQSVVMLAASLVLWSVVYYGIGGWAGLETRLNEVTPTLADEMLHVGGRVEVGVPAWLVVVGWIILLTAYSVVNHSQAMRLLSSRSEWDMKMAAFLAGGVTAVVMWFNVTLGIMGRALFPRLDRPDEIFPRLLDQFFNTADSQLAGFGPVLLGVVVAGLLAGGISTYDSIGSALSAVFTRDVYARFFVKRAPDHHYVTVSRVATFVMIGLSFLYIPYMNQGIVNLYLKLTGVAVVPLLTVYLLGVLTPVHRSAGTIGLIVGIVCGLTRFSETFFDVALPDWWVNSWWGYLWSIGFTAAAMVITSLVRGWASAEELRAMLDGERSSESATETWLEKTHREVQRMPKYSFDVPAGGLAWWRRPLVWMVLLFGVVCWFNLVVFW